jgi:hypothetical protein
MQYNKKQDTQLVYVAMSRATSLDGLHLVNLGDDNKFYHGRGNNSPSTREIRDEYTRLEQHPLPTISKRALRFFDDDDDDENPVKKMRMVAHNVQSILAHSKDIETDELIRKGEYLALCETWMDGDNLVQIDGYELANYKKRDPGRTAGGVAIYRSVDALTQCEPVIPLPEIEQLYRVESGVGDICLVSICLHGRSLCVLGSIYVHPNVKTERVKLLCLASVAQYGKAILSIFLELDVELDIPIALMGDININVNKRHDFASWLEQQFGLVHHPFALPTTLGGTSIDHIFLRNMNAECMPFISYFSYHKPLLNKLDVLARLEWNNNTT